MAAVAGETQECPRNNQSQKSAALGITEDYFAQVSENIEGKVTQKLSQKSNRTESRILGALSKLDEFLLNPQIRKFSGTTPGIFRNTDVENQEPSGDGSQNDSHPEMEFSACRASNLTDSDPEETSHALLFDFWKLAWTAGKSVALLSIVSFKSGRQSVQLSVWVCYKSNHSDQDVCSNRYQRNEKDSLTVSHIPYFKYK